MRERSDYDSPRNETISVCMCLSDRKSPVWYCFDYANLKKVNTQIVQAKFCVAFDDLKDDVVLVSSPTLLIINAYVNSL